MPCSKDPARVEIAPRATTVEKVVQHVIHAAAADKLPLLADLLGQDSLERTLVFTRTKHGADKVVRGLAKFGFHGAAIHGNKSQGQRERALEAFKSGKVAVLVATDIAARGIDIDDVSHVINFDLPHVPESYVHRIGRTARAGAGGTAIAFCAPAERPLLADIERTIRMKVPVMARQLSLRTPADGERLPPRQPAPQQRQQRQQRQHRQARPNGHRGNNGHPRQENRGQAAAPRAKAVAKTGSSWMQQLDARHRGNS